jgi:hypothetical protein
MAGLILVPSARKERGRPPLIMPVRKKNLHEKEGKKKGRKMCLPEVMRVLLMCVNFSCSCCNAMKSYRFQPGLFESQPYKTGWWLLVAPFLYTTPIEVHQTR